MIILTNPIKLPSGLGSPGSINYDKVVIDQIQVSPKNNTINAVVFLSCSADNTKPVIVGTLTITIGTSLVDLEVPSIGFFQTYNISGALSTVMGWISGLQNNIENGLVNLGATPGVQSVGV